MNAGTTAGTAAGTTAATTGAMYAGTTAGAMYAGRTAGTTAEKTFERKRVEMAAVWTIANTMKMLVGQAPQPARMIIPTAGEVAAAAAAVAAAAEVAARTVGLKVGAITGLLGWLSENGTNGLTWPRMHPHAQTVNKTMRRLTARRMIARLAMTTRPQRQSPSQVYFSTFPKLPK